MFSVPVLKVTLAIGLSGLSNVGAAAFAETNVTARDLEHAAPLRPTCYDDGAACPGSCDAHVVAKEIENGTARLHAPGASAANWTKCARNADCEVCLDGEPEHCFRVMFRGHGPESGRADFTATFWSGVCATEPASPTLAGECRRIRSGAARFATRKSCLAEPNRTACVGVVPDEAAVREAHRAIEACEEKKRRLHSNVDCNYQGPGGRLSPGACQRVAVSKDGWDCCNGDAFHDACVTTCDKYYVKE
jgi:hypothetical protein